jgi:hypothetical protein
MTLKASSIVKTAFSFAFFVGKIGSYALRTSLIFRFLLKNGF